MEILKKPRRSSEITVIETFHAPISSPLEVLETAENGVNVTLRCHIPYQRWIAQLSELIGEFQNQLLWRSLYLEMLKRGWLSADVVDPFVVRRYLLHLNELRMIRLLIVSYGVHEISTEIVLTLEIPIQKLSFASPFVPYSWYQEQLELICVAADQSSIQIEYKMKDSVIPYLAKQWETVHGELFSKSIPPPSSSQFPPASVHLNVVKGNTPFTQLSQELPESNEGYLLSQIATQPSQALSISTLSTLPVSQSLQSQSSAPQKPKKVKRVGF